MLREVVRLAGGRPVIGLAPSAAAARILSLETGIGTTTLQWLLARYGSLEEGPELEDARTRFAGAVIVVDEASMIGTVQMRDLQRVVDRLGAARLALVGDRLQLRAVEAGQPFRLLQDAGMETALMDDVLRQRSLDLKAAVTHMIAGDADLAVRSLGQDVREIPPDRLAETAARLWLALPAETRARTLLLAPTHAQRAAITRILRRGLATEGVLTGRTLTIERLVDRRLTRVLAADPLSYHPGDIVVANRTVYGCRAGEAWRVTANDPDWITVERRGVTGGFTPSGNAARNIAVFETRPIDLRAGDAIVFTRALPDLGVVNGERGTLASIGRTRLRIALEDGRRLTLRCDDDRLRHIDHAWTATVHRAQGRTTDQVIAVLDAASMLTDRALLYVEMSRARDGFVLLTDDREQLIHRLEQDTGIAHSALEATGQIRDALASRAIRHKEPLQPVRLEREAPEMAAAPPGRTVPNTAPPDMYVTDPPDDYTDDYTDDDTDNDRAGVDTAAAHPDTSSRETAPRPTLPGDTPSPEALPRAPEEDSRPDSRPLEDVPAGLIPPVPQVPPGHTTKETTKETAGKTVKETADVRSDDASDDGRRAGTPETGVRPVRNGAPAPSGFPRASDPDRPPPSHPESRVADPEDEALRRHIRLQDLGTRLARGATRIRRITRDQDQERERETERKALERGWLFQRMTAHRTAQDLAFLPGTSDLVTRTRTFALLHPGVLSSEVRTASTECAALHDKWTRFQARARELAGSVDARPSPSSPSSPSTGPSPPSGAEGDRAMGPAMRQTMWQTTGWTLERALTEAEALIADPRVAAEAHRTGLLPSVTATITTLKDRLGRDPGQPERIKELRQQWTALETEARQQGGHPFHVPGYASFIDRLRTVRSDRSPDLAARLATHRAWTDRAQRLQKEVETVMAFDARRRAIITSAARWRPETPLDANRLTRYGRWLPKAPAVLADGQRLVADPLLAPDARTALTQALDRITDARDGCGLEAKHLGILEAIHDQAGAQGCHRFFIAGYDRFIISLGTRVTVGPGGNRLAARERKIQDNMRITQARVHDLERDLAQTLQERQDGGDAFVAHMHPYRRWEQDARRQIESVRWILDNPADYGPHLDRAPRLAERLQAMADTVTEQLRADAPVRTQVTATHDRETEQKIAQIRARERARSRNRSRGLGLGL